MSSEANERRPLTDIPTEPNPADSQPSGLSPDIPPADATLADAAATAKPPESGQCCEPPSEPQLKPSEPTVSPDTPEGVSQEAAEPTPNGPRRRQKILIGSQRDPAAYRPKSPGGHIPVVDDASGPAAKPGQESQPDKPATSIGPSHPSDAPPVELSHLAEPAGEPDQSVPAAPAGHFPPPNIRDKLPAELEAELEAAMAGSSLDELFDQDEAVTKQDALEPESKLTGRIVMIRREDVFVELGGREQGVVPLKQFAESPELEAEIEVVVTRFDPEEGLYELTLPHAAADVSDWEDLEEGMIVEAKVTGHNSGGLECEVNRLRGFIPISQISLYRVEDLAPFIDEKFRCVVTEVNPQRRNLVLSRRAMLEREREEARQQLLSSLAPGQVYEGVVRKLMDFGAFVDIGGVDGLLHVSQLAWGRIGHPREVLSEGQTIKVKIEKYDPETGRISLAYRDMLENPWTNVESKFPLNTQVQGKVTKLMEFGAFVELEPGVEGLVHISELSHKRVWRASDVVQEGQEIEVLVKSIDTDAQRIGLSMKDLLPEPQRAKDKQADDDELESAASKTRKQPTGPLKGGLGRSTGGEKFGLKW